MKGPTKPSIFTGWFKFLHVPIGRLHEHRNEGLPDELRGILKLDGHSLQIDLQPAPNEADRFSLYFQREPIRDCLC